jgi:AraC-like DNA-binding protein
MEKEKMYLDNDLNLPTIAEKLCISIHEASFLINETVGDNFYNFINKYRIEEAKRLLASTKIEQLNILGIAFASGFNSKTTFNTTFKRIVGISPSQYSKEEKK